MAWIDLAQFAAKYGVSQSTLRRRIRANTIIYRLERGKYFLEDSAEVLNEAPLFARNVNHPSSMPPSQRAMSGSTGTVSYGAPATQTEKNIRSESPQLEDENRKLKKQLEELETFVSALEAEIRRLQSPPTNTNEFGVSDTF